jgi:hypothetical protein
MSNNSQPEDNNFDSELLVPPPSSKDPITRRFSRQLNIALTVDHWFVIDPVAMAEFIGEENCSKTLEQMIEEILEAECNYRMSRVWELLNRHRRLREVDGEDLPQDNPPSEEG